MTGDPSANSASSAASTATTSAMELSSWVSVPATDTVSATDSSSSSSSSSSSAPSSSSSSVAMTDSDSSSSSPSSSSSSSSIFSCTTFSFTSSGGVERAVDTVEGCLTSFAGILKGPPARLMHSNGSHPPSAPEPHVSSPQPMTPSSTVTVMPCNAAERSSAAIPAPPSSLVPLVDFTGELVAVAKTSSESSSSSSASTSSSSDSFSSESFSPASE